MKPSSQPGDRVLRDPRGRIFEVVRRLGEDRFGEVVLAIVHGAGGITRPVAIKLLHPELTTHTNPVQHLRDEIQLLAGLDHPVIRVPQELTELDGRVALIAEYLDGQDLDTILHSREPLPHGPVLDVVEQIADALHVAWSDCAIVHRDVKPQNIRVGAHGSVALLDFAIARTELLGKTEQTTEGALLGSLAYLAPERYDAERALVGPHADVFALGCVLYQAWTRTALFDGLEGNQLLILTADAAKFDPWLADRLADPGLEPIRDLLTDMLAFDPLRRITALAVAERCDTLAGQLPGRQTLRRWARERRNESSPTERISAVDASRFAALDDEIGDSPANEGRFDDSETDLAVVLPSDAALLETAPAVPLAAMGHSLRPGPVDPRPNPLPVPQVPRSQATTRWIAPVIRSRPPMDPSETTNWSTTLTATLALGGAGLLLVVAYVAGLLDLLGA